MVSRRSRSPGPRIGSTSIAARILHGFESHRNSHQDKDIKSFVCVTHGVPRHEKVFHAFNVSVLYFPESPSIDNYDEGSELREGDRKSLKCSAVAGNPPAKLKWYRGENEVLGVTKVISGHISSVLSLEVEASDNEIFIRCEVNSSLLMEPLSATVKLNVLFPPPNVTISINPPQPREGEMVRLECISGSSNPAAHIFWWKEGTLLKERSQVQKTYSTYGGSSTRSHISVPVTSSDDNTRFACEAKNEAFQRSVQEEIYLRVLYAPVFVVSDKVVELVEGRSAEVNMTAKAYPTVHSYKWSKDGSSISRKNENARQHSTVTAEEAVLYFNPVSRQDSGVYTCVAQNTEGSASATLTLNVLYPATVFNVSGTTEVQEGESVRLQCSADGNPVTENTISWKTKGESKPSVTSFSNELSLSILSIVNVSRQDAGIFECVADNRIGRPSVKTTQLIVQYRPTILRKLLLRRIAASENDSAEVQCIADGYPDVTFAWSFNASTINPQPEDFPKYTIRQAPKAKNEWWSTLLIKKISRGDYGVYTCIAGNQFGHDFVTFNVVKRSVPDIPQDLKTFNVSHQGAVLMWTASFDGGLTQTFQLRLQKNQENTMTFIPVPINYTSYILSGLSQGSTYQVSIVAKNMLGESPYTAPITFRTKSLPVMDSTVSGPVSNGSSSVEFLPSWLMAAAVISGVVVVANILVCIIYIRRKPWCRNSQGAESSASDDEISREKMTKKFPSEDHSPFYLTGASVDMPDDGMEEDAFQKAQGIKLRQVSRESSEDGYSLGRRCNCGGRQWSSTLICGGRSLGEERGSNQHEQCPDILKRDSCHCHVSSGGTRVSETEAEICSSVGAVMYGMKEVPCEPPQFSPPQITLTTFQSKSELPIRHTIIGPKLETVINGHGEDS